MVAGLLGEVVWTANRHTHSCGFEINNKIFMNKNISLCFKSITLLMDFKWFQTVKLKYFYIPIDFQVERTQVPDAINFCSGGFRSFWPWQFNISLKDFLKNFKFILLAKKLLTELKLLPALPSYLYVVTSLSRRDLQ